jgi:mRNA interferase MazF
MGLFAAGEVVILPFPYTDLSPGKLRPVLLVASAGRRDWIVCQITSNPYADLHPIAISFDHFVTGGLPHTSYLRPGKLFTAHESIIVGSQGVLKPSALDAARNAVAQVIQGVIP